VTDDSPFLPEEDSRQPDPSPWGFRITLGLILLYLGYRLWQGIVWVIDWAF
jgi:hypothetical protein